MQPDAASTTNVFRDQRNTSTNLNDKSIDNYEEQSPKLKLNGYQRRESGEDDQEELLVDGNDSVRKVSIPSASGLMSMKQNTDVVKRRVRGDIRAVIA